MKKISEDTANKLLSRLDSLAMHIEKHQGRWRLSSVVAQGLIRDIDKVADELEAAVLGEESLEERKREFTAKVIQKDSDGPYMDTFANPMRPLQTDGDEEYMSAYGDDQSSAVHGGKSSTGRPLAP